ncbi:plasmid transfer protein [Cyclobacterium plantarum]|uniref:Plasmid transfer protein n=1 Tax=Cyclobacterium plantarum TaxID=2716263 RepID=A0ABX0H493_9BACT|nr:plasmid transfer protein [Cyclobacterium plantarum]NHE56439.1 plasmid transfer protein [Cyclobacterium plantarum]
MKNSLITFALFLICLPMANAQTPLPADEYKEAISFLQGNGVYDRGIMRFFEGMRDYAYSHFGPFIQDAQALACVFMLIFFSIKAYEMMVGDKKMEIMPLLRPFGLLMLTMWWGVFCRIIAFPTDLISGKTEAMFSTQNDRINALRLDRAVYIIEVADKMVEYQATTELASQQAQEADKGLGTVMVDGVKGFFTDNVYGPLVQMRIRMQTNMQLLATQLLELLAIWILRICVYFIFFIQIIYSTILVILGPFSLAASILPAFRDAFTTWIARFVAVNLYVGIAYLVLYVCGLMQEYAFLQEIQKYEALLDTSGGEEVLTKLAWMAGNGILSFGLVIISFLVGAIAITTVPSISTWIISTSGITAAAATAGRTGSTLSRSGSRMSAKGILGK